MELLCEKEADAVTVSSEKNSFFDESESSGVEDGGLDDLELNPFDGLPYSSRFYDLLKQRENLPVWQMKDAFLESLLHHQIVVVSAGSKSGKSSQIPQWCAEYCLSVNYRHGTVVCTQVHKQTAVWLAMRVADEMDVNVGHEVGYVVPFENCCTNETILRYCTDEMLLREMMSNPLLSYYGVLIIDDVYERSVSTDILLGFLKDILISRPELKAVIITPPELSCNLVSYYGNVPLIEASNKPVSVEVVHASDIQTDYFLSALKLVFEIHRSKEKGDVAVFLACEQEINRAYETIKQDKVHLSPDLGELVPIPLYPHQPYSDYIPYEGLDHRFTDNKRRVVLTTSLGESLIWMTNICFVIDVGIEKRKVYNARIRAESFVTQPISRIQAEMRKRILSSRPAAKMFCLYPEEFTDQMKSSLTAKIEESNLTSVVLFLKRMDIAGFGQCDFISRPDPESLMQALEDLDYLAALDNDGNLSEFGIIMSEFPLDPQLSKSILAACEYDCVDEVLTLAAMVTAPTCFITVPLEENDEAVLGRKAKFLHPAGDHFTLINIYREFEELKRSGASQYDIEKWCQDYFFKPTALEMACVIRSELLDIMKRIELPVSEPAFGSDQNVLNIKKSLLSGYFMQTARDVDDLGNYIMLTHKQVGQLHPDSGYCVTRKVPEWVVFHEFSVSDRSCLRITSEISPDLFMHLAPQYYISNLPSSESKEILQKTTATTSSSITTLHEEEESDVDDDDDDAATGSAEPRCIIQ
uniref:Putative pre-mRNA-splicing factor ATP-dependent RNA helicase DHX32 n=1 Tax=Leptobrachium leishanense TaxID=445787 RepID=A0A8C5PYP3_9ANUR